MYNHARHPQSRHSVSRPVVVDYDFSCPHAYISGSVVVLYDIDVKLSMQSLVNEVLLYQQIYAERRESPQKDLRAWVNANVEALRMILRTKMVFQPHVVVLRPKAPGTPVHEVISAAPEAISNIDVVIRSLRNCTDESTYGPWVGRVATNGHISFALARVQGQVDPASPSMIPVQVSWYTFQVPPKTFVYDIMGHKVDGPIFCATYHFNIDIRGRDELKCDPEVLPSEVETIKRLMLEL